MDPLPKRVNCSSLKKTVSSKYKYVLTFRVAVGFLNIITVCILQFAEREDK